jgi:hypothetical protein
LINKRIIKIIIMSLYIPILAIYNLLFVVSKFS